MPEQEQEFCQKIYCGNHTKVCDVTERVHCRVQVLPSLCHTSTVHGLAYTIDPVTLFSGQDAVAILLVLLQQ